LTGIAKRTSRADVLESLLHPNRDIAPMFVTTVIETKDGRTLEGLQQDNEVYLKSDGSRFKIGVDAIQSRRMSKVSMMPSDLHQLLSAEELRNLLALLDQ
jgi:putative heme-binding domain-containing protein